MTLTHGQRRLHGRIHTLRWRRLPASRLRATFRNLNSAPRKIRATASPVLSFRRRSQADLSEFVRRWGAGRSTEVEKTSASWASSKVAWCGVDLLFSVVHDRGKHDFDASTWGGPDGVVRARKGLTTRIGLCNLERPTQFGASARCMKFVHFLQLANSRTDSGRKTAAPRVC